MIVKFWSNFTKRKNSTKQPGGDDTELNGYFRNSDAFSKMSPSLRVDMSDISSEYDVPPYTYAYIPEFDRYYYVSDWSHDQGAWIASLECDVLATYKSQIGGSSLYVLRSSAEYNGRVVDTKYPTLARGQTYIDDMSIVTVENKSGSGASYPNYWNTPLSSGNFYVGVVGANETGVSWYCMDYRGFKTFITDLFNVTPGNMQDVSEGVAKQLANPIQYVAKCYWLPFSVIGKFYSIQDVKLGFYTIKGVSCVAFDPVADMQKCKGTFTIRKHPQAASRGIFLNQAPFTNYKIAMYPWGVFDLSTPQMTQDTTVTCEWWVDFTTANAELTIKSANSLMAKTVAALGVPIPITQATVDYLGSVQSVLTGITGAVSSFGKSFTGVANAAASVIGGFQGAAEALMPTVSTVGGGGDFLAFNTQPPKMYSDFFEIASEDNGHLGRPLCEVRQLSSIPGFIICAEGEVEAPATPSELDQISEYLTSGFFYE